MNTLGKLEQKFILGEITEEEYLEKKNVYIETLLEMYCMDIITKEQLYERLNK